MGEPKMEREITPTGMMTAKVVNRIAELGSGDWDRGGREVRDGKGAGEEWPCAGREDTSAHV